MADNRIGAVSFVKVSARIAELKRDAAERAGVTMLRLIAEAALVGQRALNAGKYSAAIAAVAIRALSEKNESGGIPVRARIGFKNRTGRQASMRWGSRIQRIYVSG
jgi:hypothetical protein